HAAIVRIHREPLAVAAALLVAAEPEREIAALECRATIVRTQDRTVGAAIVQVGAHREIEPGRIGRIQRKAFDTEASPVVFAHPRGQWRPAGPPGSRAIRY